MINKEFKQVVIPCLNSLVVLLGMLVIIGWLTNSPALIQVNQHFVPMQFNTALCFVGLGLGSFSLDRQKILTTIFGLSVLGISFVTLLEYLLAVNIGLDELFMRHYITTYTSSPGRMAPNTAVCFLLGSICLLCFNKIRINPRVELILLISSLVILILSVTALWGYLMDIPATYSWRNLTAMAVHTALLFILISFNYLLRISDRLDIFKNTKKSSISFFIGCVIILMIWSSMKVQFENTFVQNLTGDSEAIQYELMAEFTYLDKAVHRLFSRDNRGSYSSKKQLEKDIKDYLEDIPSIDAIRMNNKLYSRTNAKDDFQPIIEQCLSKKENQFLENNSSVYYCMKRNKNVVLINFNNLMKNNLKKYSFQKINIGIYYQDKEILILGGKIRVEKLAIGKRFRVPFSKNFIEVVIQPTEKYINSEVFYLTDVFLIVAIILIVLLSIAIRNWEVSKRHLQQFQFASQKKNEVEERFQKIIEASPTVMMIASTDGIIKYITKNCQKLFLYNNNELIGQAVERLIPKSLAEQHIKYREQYVRNPTTKIMGERNDLTAIRKDKKQVPVEISLTPIIFEKKRHILCMIMDRRIDQKLKIEKNERAIMQTVFECSELTNRTDNVINSLQGCIDKICKHTKWSVGHIYFINRDKGEKLVSSEIWHVQNDINIDEFIRVTEDTTFEKGVGLPGRVWESKKPEWIKNILLDSNFPRSTQCKDLPLRVGAAFPIMINNEILAVLEFFDTKERNIDKELIKLFSLLSVQISRLLERKKAQDDLEASEKRTRLLLESAGEGIYGLDLKGETTFVNPAAAKMLGYDLDEMIGKQMHDLIHYAYPDGKHYPKEHCPIYAAYIDGKVHRVTNEVLWKKDMTPLWVEYITSPLYQKNKLTGAVVIFNDISQRKVAEDKINKYAEELKASNQELDDFAYIASHDLKEPLRGINNFSKILLEDYEDKLDEEGVQHLKTLMRLSQRMGELINSLLTYSRVGRLDMAILDTKLEEVLNEKLEMIASFLKDNNAKVIFKKQLPTIKCDSVKIGEVFYNLITNAVKYNDSHEKIIEIDYVDKKTEYQFSIADNGIGIPKEDIPKVFKLFYRLHGREEFGGGTGAGMTIVEKIIKRHKGTIWLESEQGKGTTVYFTISKSVKTT